MPATIGHPAGYRALRSHDPVRQRPVWSDLWYPALAGARERPYAYGLGEGLLAEDAPLEKGEGHFVFLDTCTADIAANGVSLCVDRPGVDREAVHESLAPKILRFLEEALAPR